MTNALNNNQQDWRQVMLTQYTIFGTIAGLEITALTIFVTILNTFTLAEKIIFTVLISVLWIQIPAILYMINQEREMAALEAKFINKNNSFQKNEKCYRMFLNIIIFTAWSLILALLLVHVWQ